MEYIEDVLVRGLNMVFCGMALGNVSAQQRAYYAQAGNKFWQLLFDIKATDRLFSAHEFRQLLAYQIGLTDLFKDQKGMDRDIDTSSFDREAFNKKILAVSPQKLAFTSKNVGQVYFNTTKLKYGPQKEMIGETRLFTLPSTSGAANAHWIKRKAQYREYWREFVGFGIKKS